MKYDTKRGISTVAILIIVVILIIIGIVLAKTGVISGKSATPTVTTDDHSGMDMNATSTNTGTTAATSTATSTATAPKVIATVIYNGKVFSPANVTVKKGEAIKFINNSTGGMSVASDPHPSHTIYPEFDQYKTSQRGKKEFTFTFDKVGTWGYHNHLNDNAVGKITVQ